MTSELIISTIIILFGVLIGWLQWQLVLVPLVIMIIFIGIGLVINGLDDVNRRKK